MTDTQRMYRAIAVMFGVMAIPPGFYALTMPWAERVDFDVVGFLWVLQNIPQLTACALTFAFAFGSLVMFARAWWDI